MPDTNRAERERIYSAAMERYWNDAEFHARCKLAFQLLEVQLETLPVLRQVIISVHIGMMPIEELLKPVRDESWRAMAPGVWLPKED